MMTFMSQLCAMAEVMDKSKFELYMTNQLFYLQSHSPLDMHGKFALWWRTHADGLRVAVYGVGQDLRRIELAVPGLRESLCALFDDVSTGDGIRPLSDIHNISPDVVVVASLMGQSRMIMRLEEVGYTGEIVALYRCDCEIDTCGALAYLPSVDWPVQELAELFSPFDLNNRFSSTLVV